MTRYTERELDRAVEAALEAKGRSPAQMAERQAEIEALEREVAESKRALEAAEAGKSAELLKEMRRERFAIRKQRLELEAEAKAAGEFMQDVGLKSIEAKHSLPPGVLKDCADLEEAEELGKSIAFAIGTANEEAERARDPLERRYPRMHRNPYYKPEGEPGPDAAREKELDGRYPIMRNPEESRERYPSMQDTD